MVVEESVTLDEMRKLKEELSIPSTTGSTSNEEVELTEEELQQLLLQELETAKKNLSLFTDWIAATIQILAGDLSSPDIKINASSVYQMFEKDFNDEYRNKLFDTFCDHFSNEEIVTDDILFYWKFIVICLLQTNRKFRFRLEEIECNLHDRTTNLRMVKEKYMFRCFIAEDHLCYFKENGNCYYVS